MKNEKLLFCAGIVLLLFCAGCAGTSQEILPNLNPDTLQLIWEQEPGGAITQKPLLVKDVVVIKIKDGPIFALNAENGDIRWQFNTPARLWAQSLTVTLDSVLIGGEEGRLLAMSGKGGIGEWDIALAGDVISPPLVERYVVFTPTSSPEGAAIFYALNASSGETLWDFETSSHMLTSPTLTGDALYFGGNYAEYGRVYAVSASEGTQRWMYETQGKITALYATNQAVVVLGENGASIFGLDASSGDLLWEASPTEEIQWISSQGEHIVLSRERTLQSIDSFSGEILWEYQSPDRLVDFVLQPYGMGYGMTRTGEIVALQMEDGSEIWKFSTASRTPSAMTIAHDRLIITDVAGRVYAYAVMP